jgi:predicted molibdopterin-dependent oxidoreductase YjgC
VLFRSSPAEFIPTEHTAFEGFGTNNYPVDGIRILQGKSGNGNLLAPRSVESREKPKSFEGLELLMVEWMFGTTEFSAWSDSLDAGITAPYMSMHSKDAEYAGLSGGDRVSVELGNGTLEIMVSVSDRTAEGTLVIPRHQSLDWRKMKDFRVRVLPEKIRKV